MWRIFVSTLFIAVAAEKPYCKLQCRVGHRIENHTECVTGQEKCGAGTKCGDDFDEVKLDDGLREFIVDLHNQLRNKVASGGEKRGNQPSASNMVAMKYDKDLEYVAQCLTNSCIYKRDKCRKTDRYEHVGQNLSGKKQEHPLRHEIKLMIVDWYDEVVDFKTFWVNNVPNRQSRLFKIHNYSQMLNAESEAVGCGLTYFSDVYDKIKRKYLYLVCNYGPGGNDRGKRMYVTGEPCTNCVNGCDKTYGSLCAAA